MKIVNSYTPDSCFAKSCPSLHVTDDGRVLVQGGRVSIEDKELLTVPAHEDVVAFDAKTLRELLGKLSA